MNYEANQYLLTLFINHSMIYKWSSQWLPSIQTFVVHYNCDSGSCLTTIVTDALIWFGTTWHVHIVMWFVWARCVHRPTLDLSFDGNGHMESTIGIQAPRLQWRSRYDEGCRMTRPLRWSRSNRILWRPNDIGQIISVKWYRSFKWYLSNNIGQMISVKCCRSNNISQIISLNWYCWNRILWRPNDIGAHQDIFSIRTYCLGEELETY